RLARRPAGDGAHDLHRVLRRALQHDRRRPLRLARPEDPDRVSNGVEPLLEVRDLGVSFATDDGVVRAVDNVSLTLAEDEILAVVGESGSGKSVTVMTLLGLTRGVNARFEGTALFRGTDLIEANEEQMRRVRGNEIAMIFQDPMTSLDPVYKIGYQIAEQIQAHEDVSDA